MRQYFLVAFVGSCVAYSLYFGFAIAYDQPLGGYDIVNAFFFGFLLHMPLWMMTFLFGGLFNRIILKLKNINQIIKISICVLVVLFLIPIFDENSREDFDYLNLVFYLFDFALCFLLFVKGLKIKTLMDE
jgi:hypothetical protein